MQISPHTTKEDEVLSKVTRAPVWFVVTGKNHRRIYAADTVEEIRRALQDAFDATPSEGVIDVVYTEPPDVRKVH